MVNIYLFIELLRAASAADTADHIKSLSLANCKFANVVVLSFDKLVAQLDCSSPGDGTKGCSRSCPRSRAWCRPTSSPWSGRCISASGQSRSRRPVTPSRRAQGTQQ